MFKAFNMSAFANAAVEIVAGCISAAPNDIRTLKIYFGRLKEAYAEIELFSYPSLANQEFADLWIAHKRTISIVVEEVERHLEGVPTFVNGLSAIVESGGKFVSQMKSALDRHSALVGAQVWDAHHP